MAASLRLTSAGRGKRLDCGVEKVDEEFVARNAVGTPPAGLLTAELTLLNGRLPLARQSLQPRHQLQP